MPRKDKELKSATLTMRLTETTRAALERLAQLEGRSKSDVVALCLEEMLPARLERHQRLRALLDDLLPERIADQQKLAAKLEEFKGLFRNAA